MSHGHSDDAPKPPKRGWPPAMPGNTALAIRLTISAVKACGGRLPPQRPTTGVSLRGLALRGGADTHAAGWGRVHRNGPGALADAAGGKESTPAADSRFDGERVICSQVRRVDEDPRSGVWGYR